MGTATFEQPDRTQAPQSNDAEAYKNAIEASVKVVSELAAAFAVHENTTPDLNVIVDGGVQFDGTTIIEQAAQIIGPVVAPLVNPRIDIVELDPATGTAYIVTGVEAASPVKPAVTAGRVPLAYFQLIASTTVITNSMIVPLRFTPWGESSPPVAGYEKTAFYVDDNLSAMPAFNISSLLPTTWSSVGPTGSGADLEWIALTDLTAGYKWVELRIVTLQETHATLLSSCSLHGRRSGSSLTGDEVKLVDHVNAPSSAQTNDVSMVKIPVDSDGRFELYRNSSGGSVLIFAAYLVGFGM